MNEQKTKRCIVCEKNFVTNTVCRKGRHNEYLSRDPKCVTCSKKCSRIYERVRIYVKCKLNKR